MRTLNASIQGILTLLIILWISILPGMAIAQQDSNARPRSVQTTPASPAIPAKAYLPFVFNRIQANIQLASAWTGDPQSSKAAFLSGDPIRYVASGTNQSSFAGVVSLRWTQTSTCAAPTVIFSGTVTLQPGTWEHAYPTIAPDCQGVYTNTVQITNGGQALTLSTQFVVFPPSAAVTVSHQAFDKCALPTVAQMQTWWNSSPYSTHNLYLGGISFACPSNPLNPFWLNAVAQQGWSFILTWVGPQAPCSNQHYRMSSNATTAYQQGRAEAALAAAAAGRLGFLGSKAIYYDVESYSGASSSCKSTVASFFRGWVERLHELGTHAGAYGAPCTSYISDWAANQPAPDDIWIAHWYRTAYDPSASVWNAPCLSNTLWVNHQRLKQYAGGHTETWGDYSPTIDSSVLDGAVTTFPRSTSALADGGAFVIETHMSPQIRDMGLLSPEAGWALVDHRLLWTADAGLQWQEISPAMDSRAELLAVTFLDTQTGWIARRIVNPDGVEELAIWNTTDGGAHWQPPEAGQIPTSTDGPPAEAAFLDFVDARTGWLSLKLQSGSSFSLGRLFFTQDGGRTWQERSVPLGEPVAFLDAHKGWVAGGPAGDLYYQTEDGGRTWRPQTTPIPDFLDSSLARALSDLPPAGLPEGIFAVDFVSDQSGWAITQEGSCQGYKPPAGQAAPSGAEPFRCTSLSRLLMTTDGGSTWKEITPP